MKKILPIILGLFFFFIFTSPSLAVTNTPLNNLVTERNLETTIHDFSIAFIAITSVIIALVVVLTYIIKNEPEIVKKLFFALIVIPTLLTTVFLVVSTVYLNIKSETGGPVHWHADFEIWNCGEAVDLVDPKGFSNKIGSSTYHEHNDNRLHVEGVVLKKEDARFSNFIKLIGGQISSDRLVLPTNSGELALENYTTCPNGEQVELQAFLYSVEGKNIGRKKFENLQELADHILAPSGSVPPGDCIIIELTEPKDKTDKLCTFYKTAIKQGKFNFGGF